MSFSILTVPTPQTPSQQVYTTFTSNVDTASLEGRLLQMCIADAGVLKVRNVQACLGLMRGPINNSSVQIALTTGVPTLISLVGSSLDTSSLNFAMNTNGVLTYTGSDSPYNRCRVSVSLSMYSTVNSQVMVVQLRRNGVNLSGCSQTLVCGNGITTINNVSFDALLILTTNDTLDCTITNSTASNPAVIYQYSISAMLNFS